MPNYSTPHHSCPISHTTAPLPTHFYQMVTGLIDSKIYMPVELNVNMPFFFNRIEYVTITPDGFRYRSQIFPTVNGLFRWFKDHYQEPVPGMRNSILMGYSVSYNS